MVKMIIPGVADWFIALVTCLHCACAASIVGKTGSTDAANQNHVADIAKDSLNFNTFYGTPSQRKDFRRTLKRFNANAFFGARGKKGIPLNAFVGARGKKASQTDTQIDTIAVHPTTASERQTADFAAAKTRITKNGNDLRSAGGQPKSRQARSVIDMLKRPKTRPVLRYQNGKRVDAGSFFGVRGKRGNSDMVPRFIYPDQYIPNDRWAVRRDIFEPQYPPNYELVRNDYDAMTDPYYGYGDVIYEDYSDLDPELLELAVRLAAQDNNRGILGGSDVHVTSKRGPPSGFHAVRG